jgi:Domain of unknown function (DUF4258)
MKEPLGCEEARKLLSKVYRQFWSYGGTHCRKRMADHDIIETDIISVLRSGKINETGELENGTWRYRVHTTNFCVVVAFRGLADEAEKDWEVVVVTAWRKNR